MSREFALAQLRHAYMHCVNGSVGNTKAFAALLTPAIVELERDKPSKLEMRLIIEQEIRAVTDGRSTVGGATNRILEQLERT